MFLVFCSVIALLVAPGIAAANCVEGTQDCDLTGFRDESIYLNPATYNAIFTYVFPGGVFNPNAVVVQPELIGENDYTPKIVLGQPQPGYIPDNSPQYKYEIFLPGTLNTQLPNVQGLDASDPSHPPTGGVLLLSDVSNLTVPTSESDWLKKPFIETDVSAIVFFFAAETTAIVYEFPSAGVPEPGVLFLLGSGLIGLVGLRRMIKK